MLQQQRRDNAIQRNPSLLAFFHFVQWEVHSLLFCMHITSMSCITDKACILGLGFKNDMSSGVTMTILIYQDWQSWRIAALLSWNTQDICGELYALALNWELNYFNDLGRQMSSNHISFHNRQHLLTQGQSQTAWQEGVASEEKFHKWFLPLTISLCSIYYRL